MYNLVDRDLSWVLQLYPLAVLSRHLLALLLSDGGALLLSLVLGHGPRHLLALLPGRLVAFLAGNLQLNKVKYVCYFTINIFRTFYHIHI